MPGIASTWPPFTLTPIPGPPARRRTISTWLIAPSAVPPRAVRPGRLGPNAPAGDAGVVAGKGLMTGYVRHKAVHAAGMKSPIARRAVAAVVVYAAG
jgi:hypothetical protein